MGGMFGLKIQLIMYTADHLHQFPHLIVPVNSKQPNKAYGTSFNGTVGNGISSIFNFDVPASDNGKTCTLTFAFPAQSQLETSAYSMSGNGTVYFAKLSNPATTQTTYANAPSKSDHYGSYCLQPGNAYAIAQMPCAAGQSVAFEMSAQTGTVLNYFQDYNP